VSVDSDSVVSMDFGDLFLSVFSDALNCVYVLIDYFCVASHHFSSHVKHLLAWSSFSCSLGYRCRVSEPGTGSRQMIKLLAIVYDGLKQH